VQDQCLLEGDGCVASGFRADGRRENPRRNESKSPGREWRHRVWSSFDLRTKPYTAIENRGNVKRKRSNRETRRTVSSKTEGLGSG